MGVESAYLLPVPAVLVLIHAAAVGAFITRSHPPLDRHRVEHHIDSIYYTGFLFTLVALTTLFLEIGTNLTVAQSDAIFVAVMHTIGVAVTTSIAGMLGRTVVRGVYLRHTPVRQERTACDGPAVAEEPALEAARPDCAAHEVAYIEALDRFVAATTGFAESLSAVQRDLVVRADAFGVVVAEHAAAVERAHTLTAGFLATSARLVNAAEKVPLEELNAQLERFRTGVGELDGVLDALITVLEHKVRKVA